MGSARKPLIRLSNFRWQLMLWFGGLALAVLLSVGTYVGRIATEGRFTLVGEALFSRARAAADLLNTNLRERRKEIDLLRRMPLFKRGDLQGQDVRRILEMRQQASNEYAWIGIANPEGRVIQATNGLLVEETVSKRPWFQVARERVFVGDVHEAVLLAKRLPAAAPGEPLRFIDFAAPILDGQGNLRGVLGSHAHWKWVTDKVESVVLEHMDGRQVEVLIADRQGNVLYPFQYVGQVQLPALDTTRHYGIQRWSDGRDYIASAVVAGLADPDPMEWQIILRQPVDVALQPISALRNQLLLFGLAATLVFAAIAYRLAISVSRPVEALARAARAVEDRHGAVAFPQVERPWEIAELNRSMQSMTGSLLRQETQLREMNESLERQVQERTQELSEANQALERLANFDALTGVYNRRRFDEKLQDCFQLFKRDGRPFSLLVIDVDHFKRINDNHGHPGGDAVLRQLARLLQESSRSTDFVARYGGEEFVVLTPGSEEPDEGRLLGEKIRTAVAAGIFPGPGRVTISIGVGTALAGDGNEDSILQRADQALYRAKNGGRNQVAVQATAADAPPETPLA